jgi:hypothetical protein
MSESGDPWIMLAEVSRERDALKAERDSLKGWVAEITPENASLETELVALKAEVVRLREMLTTASEVINKMMFEFRNCVLQPPDPHLIQAGKIVFAAIRAALSEPNDSGGCQ